MKKIIFLFFITGLLFFSCENNPSATRQLINPPDADSSFSKFSANFIEDLWKLYPGWASSQGYHKYDSVLVVTDEAFHQKEIAFANEKLEALKKMDITKLSSSNKTDFHILDNMLNGIIFNVNEFREYEWNPASYNVSSTFADILQNKNEPNEEKLRALSQRMKPIKAYYENAKKMIKNPTIEHTDLAIQQNKGGEEVFTGMMMDSLAKCKMDEHEIQIIEMQIKYFVKVIDDYVSWLKDLRSKLNPPKSPFSKGESEAGGFEARSFRIGKDLYEKKFMYDIQSHFTAEEIYNKAVQRKDEIQKEMLGITKKIFHNYFPNIRLSGFTKSEVKMLIDEISKKHVKPGDFQTEIEKQIPMLTKFVSDKNLLYMDPAKPLVVRKEPAYMAGVAGASMSSPGPYDKEGNSYYNVGSLAHYSKEEAESYLREYNHYILQILSIHEAIPGHYAQLIYSNQSPSRVKSLFGNGAMIEGWAVYSERLMLENGFGAGPDSLEMWLMYYKWHLRSVCNTILDYSVHVRGMSKEDAIKFLVEDAFQQKQEAENKWKRVSLTQVQLDSYFTGFTEIYELREEMKKKLGEKFNLKEFNEKFLSYGSAPVKYIRQLMLEN
ncbi:MAG: DUF885 domain-containing protein [Bacteroidetes bacterium]|nr:DUF885 domain-containing protein [Bacteroidota bacterium]